MGVVRRHTDKAHGQRMTPPLSSRYRLSVTGQLPKMVIELVADRFESAAVFNVDENCTVVDIDGDQAALRALMTLLWDVGHDVRSVSQCGSLPSRPATDSQ